MILVLLHLCFKLVSLYYRKNLPSYWEKTEQGKQSLPLKPQDNKKAVCESAVQENLVGRWEALCEAAIVNQSHKDNREEWARRSG